MTIDGTWRECTPEEVEALGIVVYECVRHPGWMGCEASQADCVRRMHSIPRPVVGMYQEDQPVRFVTRDRRRTR